MKSNLFQFFKDGFNLVSRSPEITVISIVIALLSTPDLFFYETSWDDNLILLTLPLLFIYSAFILSLPLFLVEKQHNKEVKGRDFVSITLKNLRRIILPGIGLLALFCLVFSLLVIALMMIFQTISEDGSDLLANNLNLTVFMILISITMVCFEFTAFYFSLDHQSLFRSVKNSFKAAINNLNYTFVILGYTMISCSLVLFIPEQNKLAHILINTFNSYTGLIVTASSLYYYQKILKKN